MGRVAPGGTCPSSLCLGDGTGAFWGRVGGGELGIPDVAPLGCVGGVGSCGLEHPLAKLEFPTDSGAVPCDPRPGAGWSSIFRLVAPARSWATCFPSSSRSSWLLLSLDFLTEDKTSWSLAGGWRGRELRRGYL
jgi:hypothetical protein